MATSMDVLRLAPAPEEVVLVGALAAARLERGGATRLSAAEAILLLEKRARVGMTTVRAFAESVQPTSLRPLRFLDERRLLAALCNSVKAGALIALRTAATASSKPDDVDKAGLVLAAIEAELRAGAFAYKGQTYRLVPGWRLQAILSRTNAQALRPDVARSLINEMSRSPAYSQRLRGLLSEAGELLAKPWSVLEAPDGIVLVRQELIRSDTSRPDVERLTPGQLRKLRDEGWIEIEFVDAGLEPVPEVEYEVRLPDGQLKTGKTGKNGLARLDGIPPGECRVRFPQVKSPVARV